MTAHGPCVWDPRVRPPRSSAHCQSTTSRRGLSAAPPPPVGALVMAEQAIELEKIGLVPGASVGDLRKQAVQMGVAEDAIEAARDSDNPKMALQSLIIAASPRPPAPAPRLVPQTVAVQPAQYAVQVEATGVQTAVEGAPSSAQLHKHVSLKPWTTSGLVGDVYLGERKGTDAQKDGPASPTDKASDDLKNITLNVVNTDKEQAIAHVVSMASAHDADIQSKHARVELQEIDVQGILRPEEKIVAQLPVKFFNGFPHADDGGEMDVKGNCALALIEVDEPADTNPLNKTKPKGPQTLVFMYTGEVSHSIQGSGYEVCKGGFCCNKEYHKFELSRSQGSGMGTVQVQTQLVNISCEEKNELRIWKEGLPLPKEPCCTIKCCCKCMCDICCVCCSCFKLPTLKYDIDIADDEVEAEALLGETTNFGGAVGDLKWSMTEESLVVNQITMKWLDPVSQEIKTTTAAISPKASRQEIACVASFQWPSTF
jgi:hypothetical protein